MQGINVIGGQSEIVTAVSAVDASAQALEYGARFGRVVLAPLGTGADDWARAKVVWDVCAANKWPCIMAGTVPWVCDSVVSLPSQDLDLEFAPGSSIVASLTCRGGPTSPYNAVFGYDGVTTPLEQTQAAVAESEGATSLRLEATCGIVARSGATPGSSIAVQDASHTLHMFAFEVMAISDTLIGDAQLSALTLTGVPAGTILYYEVTKPAAVPVIDVFSDAGKTAKVMTGTRVNDTGGVINMTEEGGSGYTGVVTIAATVVPDTTADNRMIALTCMTLDRPLVSAVPIASNVRRYVRGKNIRIKGNGCSITGTFERALSIAGAWASDYGGFVIDGSGGNEYACSLDTSSYNSHMRNIRVYNHPACAFAIEGAESCTGVKCVSVSNPGATVTNAAFMFQAAHDCAWIDCVSEGRTGGSGAGLLVGFITDTLGSPRCRWVRGVLRGNLYGADISGSSQGFEFIDTDVSKNTSHGIRVGKLTVPTRIPGQVRMIGGSLRFNGGAGFYADGTPGNRLVGVKTEENGLGAAQTVNGGEIAITDSEMTESVSFVVKSNSATDRLVVRNSMLRSTNAGFCYGVWALHGTVTCTGLRFDFANGSANLLLQQNGTMFFADCVNVGALVGGGFLQTAGLARRGDNADFTNTAVPLTPAAAANVNWGTFTLNGVTEVDVAGNILAGDTIKLSLKTVGGTPGNATPYFDKAQAAGHFYVKSPTAGANDIYNWHAT